MASRCKICANEITEPSLQKHIIANHEEHADSVRKAYPNLHDDLFENGELAIDFAEDDSGSPEQESTTEETSNPERPAEETGTTTTAVEQDGNQDDDSGQVNPDAGIDRGTAKKWLMIGVGGAGNHILDAVLMRRDTLNEENHELADVWKGGIADYLNLNTNRSEIHETYYSQIDKEYSPEALVSNCMIGHNEHAYSGAGRDWKRGRDWMEADFEGETNAFRDRWDIDRQSLGGAQAIMLLHSVTKGTGCGATPVLAENLREMLESTGPGSVGGASKPVLSSVVLPNENEFGGSEMVRGVIGVGRLSKTVDAIIPFDNTELESIRSDLAADINEEWLRRYNPPKYTDVNRLIVSFFEGFTMSSTPISYDASATQRISGDMFDVPDSIRPAKQKYPVDMDVDYDPAVVMVPVLGRHDEPTDQNDLDTLARSTLLQGQFIDFDPATAWGGTFMIYGPRDKMEDLAPLLMSNELSDILGREDFLDRASAGPGESVDVYVNQMVVPQLDSVHLWGLVWNPRLPSLESMYDHAEQLVSNSNSRQAQALDEVWNLVEPVFGNLGRENMG